MPPFKPPVQRGSRLSSVSAGLLRAKVLVNLVISLLFRIILAVVLFVVVVALALGALMYPRWLPVVSGYLSALNASSTAQTSTSTHQ